MSTVCIERFKTLFPNIEIKLSDKYFSLIKTKIEGKGSQLTIEAMLDSTCENLSKTVYARHDIIHSKKGKNSLYFIFTPNMIRYLQNEQHEIVHLIIDLI